jgi:hypothetical protein
MGQLSGSKSRIDRSEGRLVSIWQLGDLTGQNSATWLGNSTT